MFARMYTHHAWIDYQGPRDAKSMVDYFLSSQPSNVQFVKWNEKDVKSKKSITLDNFLQTKVCKRESVCADERYQALTW